MAENRECEQIKRLAIEAITEIYNWHILKYHNADFEVCDRPVCAAVRELDEALDLQQEPTP